MTISRSFVKFLENSGFGTFGTDLFLTGVPQDAPDKAMWVLWAGGVNIVKNDTGEKQKNYIFSIYFRSLDAEEVDSTLLELEELINSKNCIDLEEYVVLETETTLFSSDQDIDNQNRTVGLVEVTITVYQE